MRYTVLAAILAGAAALTGCASAVAVHPLYTKQDLVSDLPLEGNWRASDGETWQVTKSGDGYDVKEYNVHLLRLKGYEFLDVASKSDPEIGVAGHLFAKIRMEHGALFLATMNEQWLARMVEAGVAPRSTPGEGQQIILIAPTSELQQFVLLHVDDPDAWDEDEEGLHRVD